MIWGASTVDCGDNLFLEVINTPRIHLKILLYHTSSLQLSATNRNIVDCCSSLHHNKRIKIGDWIRGIICMAIWPMRLVLPFVLLGSFVTHLSLYINYYCLYSTSAESFLYWWWWRLLLTVLRGMKVKKSFTGSLLLQYYYNKYEMIRSHR